MKARKLWLTRELRPKNVRSFYTLWLGKAVLILRTWTEICSVAPGGHGVWVTSNGAWDDFELRTFCDKTFEIICPSLKLDRGQKIPVWMIQESDGIRLTRKNPNARAKQ